MQWRGGVFRAFTIVVIAAGPFGLAVREAAPDSAGQGTVRDAPARRAPGDQPQGTGTLSGTVSVSPTGQPAVAAEVNLLIQEPVFVRRTTLTDPQGHYVFTGLRAGRYRLEVSKPGYVQVAYGQQRPGGPGTAFRLADGERRRIDLQLPAAGVITGMVLNEHGEPAVNAQVRALRQQVRAGRRVPSFPTTAMTDDRGVYRIHSLQPGDYAVCVTAGRMGPSEPQRLKMQIDSMQRALEQGGVPAEARQKVIAGIESLRAELARAAHATGYAPVCYPGDASPSAAPTISVSPAEERTAIDLQLRRTRVAQVEGTLLGLEPEHRQRVHVMLFTADEQSGGFESIDPFSASTDSDGRFWFGAVPPGRYTLFARTMPLVIREPGTGGPPKPIMPPPSMYAMGDVEVTEEGISGLAIEMQRGTSLSGQVVFDGAEPVPDYSRIRINLNPQFDGRPTPFLTPSGGGVDERGRFTVDGLMPGTYNLQAMAGGPGWFVASAMRDRADLLDGPLTISPGQDVSGIVLTFTDRRTELTGLVTTETGEPADYFAVVYPADEQLRRPGSRRVRATQVQTDGTFAFVLPPGDYLLAAVPDPEVAHALDAEVMRDLEAGAQRVTVRDGQRETRNLRVRK